MELTDGLMCGWCAKDTDDLFEYGDIDVCEQCYDQLHLEDDNEN